jgi:lysophospholipase L1-like esterase
VSSDIHVPVYRSGFDPPRVDHWNALLRAAAARHPDAARVVDLNQFASPGGYTDTLDGVAPLRGDGVHFTDPGADLVARWLLPRLADVATLAAPRDG